MAYSVPKEPKSEAQERGVEAAMDMMDAQVSTAYAKARIEQEKHRCWKAFRWLIYSIAASIVLFTAALALTELL